MRPVSADTAVRDCPALLRPLGPRDFIVNAYRYGLRVHAHVGLLTGRYPPFALRA